MSRILFVLVFVIVAVTGLPSAWPQVQSNVPYGVPVTPPVTSAGVAGGALFRFIPKASISERYDSNVLFLPTPEADFVTRITPGAVVKYNDDWVDMSLDSNVFGEIYFNNPGLNYVGTMDSLYMNFDNLTGRFSRRWTLRIANSFTYTPTMPSFAAPVEGSQLPADFLRGVQAYRNNMLTNGLSVQSGYAVSARFGINASFNNSILKFLDDSSAQGTIGLFNTISNVFTAGPEYRLSASDSVGVSYLYQKMQFSPLGGGPSLPITTIQGVMVPWRSTLTPTLSTEIAPGFSVVQGIADLFWTLRASVAWNSESTIVNLAGSRGIYPGFFQTSGALISSLIAVTFTYKLTDRSTISGQYGYSVNQLIQASGVAGVGSGDSTAQNVGLAATYKVSSVIALTGSYNRSEFSYTGPQAGVVVRDLVSIELKAEWN